VITKSPVTTVERALRVSTEQVERLAAKMVGIGFHGPALTSEARALIDRGVRNVILFARNVETPQQLATLTYETKDATPDGSPLMMSVDQEGGRVLRMREPFTLIPSMRQVGQVGDEKLAYQIGRIVAAEVRAVNFDMNLAPVMDVDTNPGNPVISSRSFGGTTELVTKLGVALVKGLQDGGVAACAKHFPGHGDTNKDSHHELPTLPLHDLKRLMEVELPPFAAAIRSGVAAVMSAHVIFTPIDSEFPGTLSRTILDGLLRKRLGFDGMVMSDDMQMKAIADHYGFEEAIVHAANAGVDLFWICHSVDLQNRAIDTLIKAVENGELSTQRLEDASRRIDAVFARYVKPASRTPLPGVIGIPEHQAVAEKIKRLADDLADGEDPTEAFNRQQKP
jgi:beta-N-acetylhexosaminidase